jgi:superfamily II DNA or RNA helicase
LIQINKINEVYIKIDCPEDVAYELSDRFTFEVPGAKYSPAYKKKLWDGKIRLFNMRKKTIYAGLLQNIKSFFDDKEYEYSVENPTDPMTIKDFQSFIRDIGIPDSIKPRDYQIEAVRHAAARTRSLLLSPTASGKSLIIYLLTRLYEEKTLIIVPTTSLVYQMKDDFVSYGYDEDSVHCVMSGHEKVSDKPVVISTWQSIHKESKDFYSPYKVIIGDEAHLFKAKSLTSIMEKTLETPYRFGFTGTLDGSNTNKLVLEGLFGPVKKVTTTKELMDANHLASLKVKCICLKHADEIRKIMKGATYQQEIDYLCQNESRNNFIKNLALTSKGNTLVLFQMVEKQGKMLFDLIKDNGKNVFYVDGSTKAEDREYVRKYAEENDNVIIVASYGVFSTGVNIKKLHNVIFASPSKSRVRNLQSIGRGLRKSSIKDTAIIWDISDDIKHRNRENYTYLHFKERLKIYTEEKFNFKVYEIDL